MDAEQSVDALVHAALLAARVDVKAAAGFAPQAAGFHQRRDARSRRRLDVIAIGFLHHPRDFDRDVEAHFVEQRHRPDGEAETHGHAVDLLDRRPLGQEVTDFVRVGRQDPVHPEARGVLHDNHRLAQPPPKRNRRADRLRRRAGTGDHLKQRHLRDGREKMHPDDALRVVRRLGDARDRNRGGVGCEHAVLGEHLLDFPQHLLLDGEVLEHRLDRQLGATEPGVGIAAGEQGDEPRVFVLRDATPLQPIVEDGAGGESSLGDAAKVGVLHPHVDLRLGHGGARDAGAHEP